MISVTRLDGEEIVLNDDLLMWIERTPDTVLALTTGERVLVRETPEEIITRVVAFKRQVFLGPVVKLADEDSIGN